MRIREAKIKIRQIADVNTPGSPVEIAIKDAVRFGRHWAIYYEPKSLTRDGRWLVSHVPSMYYIASLCCEDHAVDLVYELEDKKNIPRVPWSFDDVEELQRNKSIVDRLIKKVGRCRAEDIPQPEDVPF